MNQPCKQSKPIFLITRIDNNMRVHTDTYDLPRQNESASAEHEAQMTPVFTVTRKVPPELLDLPNLDFENSSIVPQMCVEEEIHVCPIKSNQSMLYEKLNNIYKELNTVSPGLTADKQLCSNLARVDPQRAEYWNHE